MEYSPLLALYVISFVLAVSALLFILSRRGGIIRSKWATGGAFYSVPNAAFGPPQRREPCMRGPKLRGGTLKMVESGSGRELPDDYMGKSHNSRGTASPRERIKAELEAATAGGILDAKMERAKVDELVDQLVLLNPTDRPGKDFEDVAVGTWAVLYAPHIYTLSRLLATSFEPIMYHLSEGGAITSNVAYRSFLFGRGWLSAQGHYSPLTDRDCRVVFENFWWDIGTEGPSSLADRAGALRELIQGLGSVGFVESLSRFPVEYLDEDMIIFRFPPLRVKIVARKQSPETP